MLLGSISPGEAAYIRSSPKTPPQSYPSAPTEDIPEIVVSGVRIPWYAWVAVGVVGFAAINAAFSRR